MSRLKRDGKGRLNPSHETKPSGVNGDWRIFISPVQLTTSRIGNPNLTRLVHTLLHVMTIHIYIMVATNQKGYIHNGGDSLHHR